MSSLRPPILALVCLAVLTAGCEIRTGGDDADAGSDADGGEFDGGSDGGRPGPFATCAEGGLTDCFSNHDCSPQEVCLDVGAAPDLVPCCAIGARGTLTLGELCVPATGETDCASSLCLEDAGEARCTDVCTADTDCPVGMQNCTVIAFSGSSDSWCLFE